MVAGFAPSSFAVRFRLPTREDLGYLPDSASVSVLDEFTQLLRERSTNPRIVEWITHARVRKHYCEFLDTAAKQGATVKWRTRRDPTE